MIGWKEVFGYVTDATHKYLIHVSRTYVTGVSD